MDDDDIAEVVAALRSGWLTTGPRVERFEAELAERCGARYAVAVSSGTAALHCAYHAAGIGVGDQVVTTPITFAATSNAVLYLGATPIFADVCVRTACLDPARAEEAITDRTRAIVPVHFAGQTAEMGAFQCIAERRGLVLIADGCHALGALEGGRSIGSLAHATVLSFHPVKHIATGEGGAVVTDDDLLARRVRRFRTHGVAYDPTEHERPCDGPWCYEQQELGFNYRITDLQCAIGSSQLRRLDTFLQRRRTIASRYDAAFTGDPQVRPLGVRTGVSHAWHLYVIRVEERRLVYERLRATGIGVQVHYIPVYRQRYYHSLGYGAVRLPNAEAYYEECLSIPIFPAMTDDDVERVVRSVRAAVGSDRA